MGKPWRARPPALLAATALMAATAACGAGDEPASGRTEVTMGTANQGAVLKSLKEIVASFNAEQSEITVTLQQYPDASTLLQKTLVQLSAGEPPTLSPCQPSWSAAYSEVNGLADMDTMLGAPDALTVEDIKDFHPVLMKSTEIDGKRVALPFDRNLSLLYYNKKLFQQAGLSTPPATWDEFAQQAAKLTTSDSWAADFFNSPYMVAVWDSMVHSYGGRILDEDQTKAAFNTQAGRDALGFWVDLAREKRVRVSSDPSVGQLNFGAGHTAMYVSDSTALSFIQESVGDKFEMAAVPLPAGPAGTFTELGGANICLFNKAPEDVQKAGFEFITYLLSTSKNGDFVKASNYLPNRASTTGALKDFYARNPLQDTAVGQLENAVDPPTTAAWPQATAAILVHLLAAVRGDETVEDALDKAEKEVNDILKK